MTRKQAPGKQFDLQMDPAIAAHLTNARIRAKLTQQELAKRIPCSRQHVSMVELGRTVPSLVVFLRWLDVCGITPLQFFGGPSTDQIPPQKRDLIWKLSAILDNKNLNFVNGAELLINVLFNAIMKEATDQVQPRRAHRGRHKRD